MITVVEWGIVITVAESRVVVRKTESFADGPEAST